MQRIVSVLFIWTCLILLIFQNSYAEINPAALVNSNDQKDIGYSESLSASSGMITSGGVSYSPVTASTLFNDKIAKVDPYSGHVQIHLPLLTVPVGGGLSINVTVNNYQEYLNYFSNLGDGENLSTGIVGIIVSGNTKKFIPFMVDPEGHGHMFYPRSMDDVIGGESTTYYSTDNWKAVLVADPQIVDIGGLKYWVWYYSGKVYAPTGTVYNIQDGHEAARSYSPVSEITNQTGKAWIKYSYNNGLISEITSSSGYNVTFNQISGGAYLSDMKTSDGKEWAFNYANSTYRGYKVLSKITLPTQLSYQFTAASKVCVFELRYAYKDVPVSITYPSGQSQTFTNTCSVALPSVPPQFRGIGTYVVTSEKNDKLPPFDTINYEYQYDGSDGGKSTRTETYGNKKITSVFDDPGYPISQLIPDWNNGLLQTQTITDTSSNKNLETITNNWQERQLSDLDNGIHGQPELTKQVIQQNGATYTLNNTKFSDLGQPLETTETGTNTRTISRTYYENPAYWVLGLASETIKNNAGNVVNTTENTYNDLGQLVTNNVNGVTTTNSYDDQGNLATVTNALNQKTSYEDYQYGHAQKIVGPTIKTTSKPAFENQFTMNPDGSIASETDSFGNVTDYTYNSLGQVTSITPYVGNTKTLAEAETVIDWNTPNPGDQTLTQGNYQRVTTYSNNANQQYQQQVVEKDTTTGATHTTINVYGQDGLVMSSSRSIGNNQSVTITNEYDALDRIISSQIGGLKPTTISYGENSKSVTDPLGNVTTYQYMNYAQPTDEWVTEVINPLGNKTSTTYDAMGRITKITQNGLSHTYTYDPKNHEYLTSESYPEIGTINYTRDLLGQMTSKTISGQTTKYTYDANGDLINITYPDTTGNITETYDYSRLQSISNPQGTWNYEYNALGKVTQTSYADDVNSQSYIFKMTYDDLGNLVTVAYPDGQTITYTPNALGEASVVSPLLSNLNYFSDGKLESYQTEDANQVTYTEDSIGRVNGLSVKHGSADIIHKTYTFDDDNNVTAIQDSVNPGNNQSMTYDKVNELTSAKGAWGNAKYTYDANGNITSLTEGKTQLSYDYNSQNQLSGVTGTNAQTFTYDDRGNMSGINGQTLTFNAANQLTNIAGKNGSVSYTYDGNGNRVNITKGSSSILQLFVNNQLWYSQETNTDNRTTKTDYIYLNGNLVAKKTNEADTSYYYNNLLGSPLGVSDTASQGALAWQQQYTPYGTEVTNLGDKVPDPHVGFTGKQFDQQTGLSYYNARYYDPLIGRFISLDPQAVNPADWMTFNRYAYVNNNPFRYIDPTGMWSMSWLFAGMNNFASGFNYGASGGLFGDGLKMDDASSIATSAVGIVAGTVIGTVTGNTERGMLTNATSTVLKSSTKGWKLGDDVYKLTAKGNEPSWTTVRTRFWKNEAATEGAAEKYGTDNISRMQTGRAPQRFNQEKAGMESMELSHEPIPRRDGGTEFVPRWPQDHAKVDSFRHPGY